MKKKKATKSVKRQAKKSAVEDLVPRADPKAGSGEVQTSAEPTARGQWIGKGADKFIRERD